MASVIIKYSIYIALVVLLDLFIRVVEHYEVADHPACIVTYFLVGAPLLYGVVDMLAQLIMLFFF